MGTDFNVTGNIIFIRCNPYFLKVVVRASFVPPHVFGKKLINVCIVLVCAKLTCKFNC